MPFQRYNNGADVPKDKIKKNRVIYGRVVKTTDGDTVRIRHLPLFPLQRHSEYEGKLSENTIPIRIYGVDAPEIAKFGNPSMPFAEEAKQFTANAVHGKVVRVKMLRKDQYSRVVGKVTTRSVFPFLRTDVSQGLAKNGLATLYEGGGAEYDGKKEKLERQISRAQKKKKGIWVNGKENVADPADYKRATKAKGKKGSSSGANAKKGSTSARVY